MNRSLSAAILCTLALTATAQTPAWQAPPKLVVGVVVDQMRVDYIYRYWSNFGEGGFKRLVQQGAFLRDAHYTYVPTITGPGHASIYTGSVPAYHGIVANDRYDRATHRMIYCVSDRTMTGVGDNGPDTALARRSPAQLLATTLADEIERRTDRQGHTIGIALKDRSSILPIGRTGDAAYWFSSTNGAFVSSTWYMKQLPDWVKRFNAAKHTQAYLKNTWKPLLPIERYHQVLPDENPYELPIAGTHASFPYDLDSLSRSEGLGLITSTPWGNTLTTEMALAAIAGEALGKDDITDLLAISYSSTDILGHHVGPRALEIEDMYIRLDQELARLLNELDKQVGEGRWTLFLTADHGAVDVPQYLADLKGSAGYVDASVFKEAIDAGLVGRNTADSTLYVGDGQIFFSGRNGQPMEMEKRMRACGIAYDALRNEPAIASVSFGSMADIMAGAADRQEDAVRNGYMPQRCGDVQYTLNPGFFEAEGKMKGKGTTHGSGWNYDTNVPVLFYGQGIVPGEVLRRTAVADIAPTISMIVGCALPDAAVGDPVPEVLQPRR
ncbi:MAG TPA: alkaline phosphatase family protein [Flavobacteriales bacterium]|jgi:predicted AlkP superfamily pyrophosphatase or phosphodiesterase|nr:alkaline phosphatase family protein [Flavobacteriales bacterium]